VNRLFIVAAVGVIFIHVRDQAQHLVEVGVEARVAALEVV